MANEIKDKFGTATALAITLASLASSIVGVGRQSDIVDNSSNKWQRIKLYISVKLGTNPAANTSVYVYLVRGDQHGTPYRSDGAGSSDAGLTVLNAGLIGVMRTKTSPATGDVLYGDFDIVLPGPEWGIAVVHDTNVAFNGTGSNFFAHYVGSNPEVQ